MKIIKYITITSIILIILIVTIISNKTINEKTIEFILKEYVKLDSKVVINRMLINNYNVSAYLEDNSSINLNVYIDSFKLQYAYAEFKGNTSIFSKVATIKLPETSTYLKISIDTKYKTILNSKIKNIDLKEYNITNIPIFNIDLKSEINDISQFIKINNKDFLINNINLKTKNENFTLKNFTFNSDFNKFNTKYRLKIDDLNKTTYIYSNILKDKLNFEGNMNYSNNEFKLYSDIFHGDLDFTFNKNKTSIIVKKHKINEIAKIFKIDNIKSGELNYKLNFDTNKLLNNDILNNEGTIDINLLNFIFKGTNIDESISKIVLTQNLNLSNLFSENSDIIDLDNNTSYIKELKIKMLHKDKKLKCIDCAISTNKNLLAMVGIINLDKKRFDMVKVGILNKEKCAYLVQPIEGEFKNIDFSLTKTGVKMLGGSISSIGSNFNDLLSVGGGSVSWTLDKGTYLIDNSLGKIPIVNLLTTKVSDIVNSVGKTTENLTSHKKCKVFYHGTVKHP